MEGRLTLGWPLLLVCVRSEDIKSWLFFIPLSPQMHKPVKR